MLEWDAHSLVNAAFLLFLLITAIGVVVARNLLIATILLSVYSFLMAGMYLLLGAPDVAITEAAIGAGVSSLLLLAALLLTGDQEKPVQHPLLPLLVIAVAASVLFYATMGLPHFGDPDAITNLHVSPYYITQSMEEMGIPNIVTSVLASYRGFDTMGEVFVVFTAGVSVFLLLGTVKGDKN